MKNKKIVLFDFDGTIWDTIAITSQNIKNILKSNISDAEIRELYTHNVDMILKLKERNHELREMSELIEVAKSHHEAKLKSKSFLGIAELIKSLSESGVILGLVTLSSRENCAPMLETEDLLKYFKYIHTKEGGLSKTSAVEEMLEKENIFIGDSVFVTDTLGDVREMNVLGVDTICVTYGTHDRSFFERENLDNIVAIVDSVEELRGHLLK